MAESTTTRSIERAFDILECFLEDVQELSLKEICEKTGLSASTVHRLLSALESRKYLKKDEVKKYHLGSMVAKLGYMVAGKMGLDFKILVKRHMLALQQKYNESVSLYVIDGDKRLCIDRVESTHQLRRVIDIGATFPLEVGAAGKVLIAHLSQDEIDDMYLHVDITSSEYKSVREQGYSMSQGEREVGVSALAVPIFNFSGKVIAAISISGPSVRLDEDTLKHMVEELKTVSHDISHELGYTDVSV